MDKPRLLQPRRGICRIVKADQRISREDLLPRRLPDCKTLNALQNGFNLIEIHLYIAHAFANFRPAGEITGIIYRIDNDVAIARSVSEKGVSSTCHQIILQRLYVSPQR